MSADYKIATGPFLFCLDEAAVLNDFFRSASILDRTASVWRNEAYSCCCFLLLFFCSCFVSLAHPDQIDHFKRRIYWNSWENHQNHQLYSEWSQNWQQKWVWLQSVTATRSIVWPTSALRNVNVVTRKLDVDQTSVAHTHTERKCDKTRGHIVILGLGNVDCTGWLTVGTELLN